MFRRLWSGLPQDASYPDTLAALGYFINEEDEVREIENPDYYFKFFINRNTRVNERHRFEFNRAIERIVHERLEALSLRKIALPLRTPMDQPHVPIFVSPDLKTKSRIVVIFGECSQDLGILAGRVVSGRGGINEGTMVSIVQALQKQASSDTDPSPPGIVIANPGQLHWWPDERRAITISGSSAIPFPSLVHVGISINPDFHNIPLNKEPSDHVRCLFNGMLIEMAKEEAKIDIIAIGDSCEVVEKFLDDEQNWAIWGSQLHSMVLLGPVCETSWFHNDKFLEFLATRARAYLVSPFDADTPLAPPTGNPSVWVSALGCPCYSSSESQYLELIFIKAKDQVLGFLETVALTPDYQNEELAIVEQQLAVNDGQGLSIDWSRVPESERPQIDAVDPEELERQMRQLERWHQFQGMGNSPESGSESGSLS